MARTINVRVGRRALNYVQDLAEGLGLTDAVSTFLDIFTPQGQYRDNYADSYGP